MNCTRNELIVYGCFIIALTAVPPLLQYVLMGMPFLQPGEETLLMYVKCQSIAQLLCYIATHILTAVYIHVSEVRGGNKTNFLWQLLGLVVGFAGFLAYALWKVMLKKRLFFENEVKAPEAH